jgi:hypothetical protein
VHAKPLFVKQSWRPHRPQPNYDLYFFEVETRSGVKMLPEMRPGEMGSMVVSTPVLPRYKIRDLIRASPAPPAPLRFAGQVCAQAHVSSRLTSAVSGGMPANGRHGRRR